MKKAILKFSMDKKFINRDAEKLRGYFGTEYRDNPIFHNHNKDGSVIYRFPNIQYKVIDGNLALVGFKEGADIICKNFFQINKIIIDGMEFNNFEKNIMTTDDELFVSDNLYTYRFLTPYLALNQKNYKAFKDGNLDLNKVLRNNILSIFKGLGVFADKTIVVNGNYYKTKINTKNVKVIGLYGTFKTNAFLPNYIGVGKRKSIGFGTILRVKGE